MFFVQWVCARNVEYYCGCLSCLYNRIKTVGDIFLSECSSERIMCHVTKTQIISQIMNRLSINSLNHIYIICLSHFLS